MTLHTPNDVTPDAIDTLVRLIRTKGVAHLQIDEGKGPKRVVIAADPDSQQIMVAMEGSGCTFLTIHSRLNPFVLVSDGFQLRAAQILTALLHGVGRSRQPAEDVAEPLQITHHSRS